MYAADHKSFMYGRTQEKITGGADKKKIITIRNNFKMN